MTRPSSPSSAQPAAVPAAGAPDDAINPASPVRPRSYQRVPTTDDADTIVAADEKITATTEDATTIASSGAEYSSTPSYPEYNASDPLNFGRHRRENVTQRQMKLDHPKGNKKLLKAFYTRQNELIDQFLNADEEEQATLEEEARVGPKIKFAVNASFTVNFCLFVIQMYAAVSTGSLSLFATAADAFMDLVSSFVMLITSKMAARPSVYKYPVGRTRIETMGIILFCALMTTVAIELIIESARTLGGGHSSDASELHIIPIIFVSVAIFAKGSLMLYCLAYRKYPSVHVFFVDHRNDIVVNIFGLIMSVVGARYASAWFADPIGAICIGLLILVSWVSNAFEQVWLLVGKSAPKEFLSKVIYMAMTHDTQIKKVETCRAYHAGQKFYVEVDIVMDQVTPLKISHDVSQGLQRKLEGLGDVERAFVHVDYENEHNPHEEHKPLYEKQKPKKTLKDILRQVRKKGAAEEAALTV